MKEITGITAQGIDYIEEEGNPCFLAFEVCYKNFLAFRQQEMDSQYSDELKQIDKEYKSVGFRRFSRLFFEFFTVPPIRFEVSSVGKFTELQYKIRKAGWHTIDGD